MAQATEEEKIQWATQNLIDNEIDTVVREVLDNPNVYFDPSKRMAQFQNKTVEQLHLEQYYDE